VTADPRPATVRLDRWDLAAGLLLAVTLLGIYHLGLLPDLPGSGDSAKLQLVGQLLGTPHATGYPTWVLLCHGLDLLLPAGSPAYRGDLLSALCSLSGTLLVAAALRRQGVSRPVTLAAAACLGLTPTLGSQSVTAEVYTLNYLFAAAVIYALLRWHQERRPAWLEAALALYALSFTNHLTTVCLAPGIAVFVLLVDPSALRRRRLWEVLAAAAACSLLVYGYVVACTYWLRVPYLEMQAVDLRELLDNLAGGPHRSFLFQLGWGALLRERLPRIAGLVGRELSLLLVLPLLGVWGRRTPVEALLGLTLLSTLGFLAVYTVPDLYVYAIPGYLALGFYLALGLQRLAGRWRFLERFPGAALLAVPALFLLLLHGPGGEPRAERRATAAHADAVMARVAGRAAVLYSLDYGVSMGLLYRSRLGVPEDRVVVVQHLPPASLGVAVSLQPLRRYLEQGESFRVGPQGQLLAPGLPVYAYVPRPEYLPALARRGLTATPVGDGVFQLHADPAAPGPPLPRAFVVHRLESVATVRAALAAFARPDFDPRRLAVRLDLLPARSGPPAAGAAPAGAADRVELRRYDDRRVTATVELSAPGWLVLADSYSSLWAARVDGRPVSSPPLDVLFRGIPLPAGRHQVDFSVLARRLSWRGWWLGWGAGRDRP
jgi:4-amino-4-deoxy-L-arabinose transferase-like glycosyltransferase